MKKPVVLVVMDGVGESAEELGNTQFGEGSLNTLERVNEMLMYQCYTLCEVTYPLMVEK